MPSTHKCFEYTTLGSEGVFYHEATHAKGQRERKITKAMYAILLIPNSFKRHVIETCVLYTEKLC